MHGTVVLTIIALGLSALPALAQPDRARLVELVEAQREFRDVLLSDPHRPTYHFVNPEGRGMPFDPNGAIFWNGKYHLCYIYQRDNRIAEVPTANAKRNIDCWGHASSVDLLHYSRAGRCRCPIERWYDEWCRASEVVEGGWPRLRAPC
jgi:sucrose-6-phosphate hydrolase SacC (GH32 family)